MPVRFWRQANTDLSLSEIALALSFTGHCHRACRFLEHVRITPSKFRLSTRSNGAADLEKSVIAPSYLKFAQELSSKRKQIQDKCVLNREACQDDKAAAAEKRFRYEENAMRTQGFLVTDPEHWRERAESIRVTANLLNDVDAKARMLRIAEGYEVLRKQTEHRRRTGW